MSAKVGRQNAGDAPGSDLSVALYWLMKPPTKRKRTSGVRRWSGQVTRTSHAMDLQPGVFSGNDARRIASSVKRSAERSRTRKANPYRSALSMITFYLNRGGKNLSATKRATLEKAKTELKRQFGRE
jgi:hypothetical protein